jgi:hypothetical protein
MKYRVVKDNGNTATCSECCFINDNEGCTQGNNHYRLPDCVENDCHFEEIEDTKEEDNG